MLPLYLLALLLAALDAAGFGAGAGARAPVPIPGPVALRARAPRPAPEPAPEDGPALALPAAEGARSALRRQILQLDENGTTPAGQGTGITPITLSADGQSYYAVIAAGEILFRVALDTGSSDTWLMSSACTSAACKKYPAYPLSYASPTFMAVNGNTTAFNVSYADTTAASGFVAREAIQISNVTAPNQAFGVVTSSNVTTGDEISGVLGLGFPRLSTIAASAVNATPFFATLAQQGLLRYPLIGLSLTRNASGTLTLGAVDSTVVRNVTFFEWNEVADFSPFEQEITRNQSGYLHWAISLGAILVNGTGLTPLPTYTNYSNTSLALLDIGTPGIFGPYQDVERIFDGIESSRLVNADSGQWAIPCDADITLGFTFGNSNFTMQPTDFLIGPTAGDPNMCLAWPQATPPRADGIDWQIGTAFLRTVYTVLSYGIDGQEPPMVGLYPLTNATAPPQPLSSVSAFFSSYSATVATTLPNFVLPTPTPVPAPAYAFNTSVPASIGQIATSDLGASTYVPVLRPLYDAAHANASAIPRVTPSPTLATLIITDTAGGLHTTISTAPAVSITLGVPPGGALSGAQALCVRDGGLRAVGVVLAGLALGFSLVMNF